MCIRDRSRIAVWDIIAAMKRDGVSVVLTTHLMDEAEQLADDVVIIDHGKVVAQGTPSELTNHDEFPVLSVETADVLDTRPLDNALAPAGLSVEEVRPRSYRVRGTGSPEVVEKLAREAARQDVLIRELSVSHRNLEDVFLDLTGRELRS